MATATIIKDVQNKEMEATIKELKEWKILQKQAEDRVKELEATIKEFLNDIGETNIACGPYTCKLTDVNRSTFNKDIVLKQDPELYEAACGSTTYKKLTVK